MSRVTPPSSSAAFTAGALPVQGGLVGVRLHRRDPAAGSPSEPKVRWLLQLGELQQRAAAEHQALLTSVQALQRALQALPATVQVRLEQVAGLAVEIGLAVAREVVGEALARGHVDPLPVVTRCLQDAVEGGAEGRIQVRLHPADLGPVMERLAAVPEWQPTLARTDLLADPGVARGAVKLDAGAGRLRWDPREVLERICQEIRRESGA